MKRTVATRSTRLKTRANPYNPSVILLEPADASPGPSTRVTEARETTPVAAVKVEDPFATQSRLSTSRNTPHRVKSPRKPKPIAQALAVPHPAPLKWQETYEAVRQMRSRITAPVDTMGCEQAQWKESDPKSRRLATLISLMLSSQTKDEVTDAAVSKLRDALGGSITVDAIIDADTTTISGAIAKVGFWRRKTEYIKKTAQRLRDDFDSDVPKTVDELCSLPGVGPKMAFLALQVAWNLNVGIGVDVHVHRITNRLGWHKPPTKTPEETRLNLQSWLPNELHPHINHMLVGFGQVVCLPVGPRCDSCDLGSMGLCPSAQKRSKSRPRKAEARTGLASVKIEIAADEDIKPALDSLQVIGGSSDGENKVSW